MSQDASFRSIIELWPKRTALSAELGQSTSELVRKWWQRDSIPAEWWGAIVALPRACEAGITLDLLAALAARERSAA